MHYENSRRILLPSNTSSLDDDADDTLPIGVDGLETSLVQGDNPEPVLQLPVVVASGIRRYLVVDDVVAGTSNSAMSARSLVHARSHLKAAFTLVHLLTFGPPLRPAFLTACLSASVVRSTRRDPRFCSIGTSDRLRCLDDDDADDRTLERSLLRAVEDAASRQLDSIASSSDSAKPVSSSAKS